MNKLPLIVHQLVHLHLEEFLQHQYGHFLLHSEAVSSHPALKVDDCGKIYYNDIILYIKGVSNLYVHLDSIGMQLTIIRG